MLRRPLVPSQPLLTCILPPVAWIIASKFEPAGPFACMLEHGARSSDTTRKWLVMSPDGGGRVETAAEIGRRVSRPDPFSLVNVCHSLRHSPIVARGTEDQDNRRTISNHRTGSTGFLQSQPAPIISRLVLFTGKLRIRKRLHDKDSTAPCTGRCQELRRDDMHNHGAGQLSLVPR